MHPAPVEKIVQTLLYEGYMLYPYRPALKNRHSWTLGNLYPKSYSLSHGGTDRWMLQTECLLEGTPRTVLGVQIRFLHRTGPVAGAPSHPWHEAMERTVDTKSTIGDLHVQPQRVGFVFPPPRRLESPGSRSGECGSGQVAEQTIEGSIVLASEQCREAAFKLTVRIENLTPMEHAAAESHDEAGMQSMLSTQTILTAEQGAFVSLLDPPPQLREVAAGCHNIGTWPILVGEQGQRDRMLSSPIILYDYPQVAPESPGDLFDSTEIDELLTLRLLTLTDDEKQQMIELDPRTHALLDRARSLTKEQFLNLHGAMRCFQESVASPSNVAQQERRGLEYVRVGTVDIQPGNQVHLRPKGGADVFDLVLAGKKATVQSIEQDYEGRVYLAVTVDDDPGSDLGEQSKPGHRFFFRPEEVEPIAGHEGEI